MDKQNKHIIPTSLVPKALGNNKEESARRPRGEGKIFEDNRDKQLPIPMRTGEVGDKEFRDVLYRCFVPEENQGVTEKKASEDPTLRVNVSKDVGWDALFYSMFKLQSSLECIKIRHLILLSLLKQLTSSGFSMPYALTDERAAFRAGTITPAQMLLIINESLRSRFNGYSVINDAGKYEAMINDNTGFVEYRDAMRAFMASDSTFILKRLGTDVQILWTGDGNIDQPPQLSLPKPPSYEFISKESYKELLESAGLANNTKSILESFYMEVYDSLFDYLSAIVPGLDSNLHSKVRAIAPFNTIFRPKVSKTFLSYLVREFDTLSLPENFMATRGKYTQLLIHRGFNKEYIALARSKNTQKTCFEDKDRVMCTVTLEDGEKREVIANMRPWSRNKKKLSVDYQGKEYRQNEVVDLRLYVNKELARLDVPDRMLHTALTSNIYFSLAQTMPEHFTRGITQTPTGTVGFSAIRTWLIIWQKLKFAKAREFKTVPKYILPYSQLAKSTQFQVDPDMADSTRTDEHGLTVDNRGHMLYIPKISEDLPARYEAILDELLEQAYASEEPFNLIRPTSDAIYRLERTTEDQDARNEKRNLLKRFKLLPLAANWNTNVVLYPSKANLNVIHAVNLDGAMVPDPRTMADWMGMSTAANGKYPNGKPAIKAYAEMIGRPNFDNGMEDLLPELFAVDAFYYWLMVNNKVPHYSTLLKNAKAHLATLDRSELVRALDDEDAYAYIFKGDAFNWDNLGGASSPRAIGGSMLKKVFDLCDPHSAKLNSISISNGIPSVDHPCYLNTTSATFERVQQVVGSMLGGVFWIELCKELIGFCNDQKAVEDLMLEGLEIEPEEFMEFICFEDFSARIMPQAKMWGVYLPMVDDILLNAHAYKKSLLRQEGFTAPAVPGIKEIDPNDPDAGGFALQPHQVDSMSYSASHPKYMILDIAPGGGKTILGLAEILIYLGEGCIKKPLVVMPINLIVNWINDCVHRLQADVNFIVITSETVKEWGLEALGEKIKNAPPNTIVCTSYNWLYNDITIAMYGIRPVRVFANVDFLMRFNFDYIAADEAHRLKGAGIRARGNAPKKPTSTHLSFLRLVSNKHVKFVRLLTGTLIKNTLLDLVGQVRLLNPAIFRTVQDFKNEYGDPNEALCSDTGRRVQQEIRKYLQEFVTIVSKRKKHWAFVMPEFEDKFDFVDPSDAAIGYYEWILKKTLEQIKAEMKKEQWELLTTGVKKKKKKGKRGKNNEPEEVEEDDVDTDANGNDDSDNDDSADGPDSSGDGESDLDADIGETQNDAAIMALLKPYLQRLEQALTDPEGDPEFERFAEHMAKEGHQIVLSPTNKLLKIYELLEEHFTGITYQKDPDTGEKVAVQGESMGALEDGANKDKVLIFCKYHRSVDAIFEHMPEKYKKYARKYSASNKSTLQDFQKKAEVKILVALEDSLQEGHNLQVASRLIRSEQVWTPGEFDQGISRVHRPDIGNKFGRKKIISNWIIVNRTLEVAKLGRLISKFVSSAKFYEDDIRYQSIDPDNTELLPIKMSLEVITGIKRDGTPSDLGKKNWTDIEAYLEAYGMDPNGKGNIQGLAQFQQDDFENERIAAAAEGRDKMVPVKRLPMPDGSAFIKHLPYVVGQAAYDPDDLGLVPLKDYIEANPELKLDLPRSLGGLPVHTAFGEGVIQAPKERKVRKKRGATVEEVDDTSVNLPSDEDDSDSEDNGKTGREPKLAIRLGDGTGVKKGFVMDVVFVITKLSTSMKKLMKKMQGEDGPETKPEVTPKSKAKLTKLEEFLAKKREAEGLAPKKKIIEAPPMRKPKLVITDTGDNEGGPGRKADPAKVMERLEKRTKQLEKAQRLLNIATKEKNKPEIKLQLEKIAELEERITHYNKLLGNTGGAPKKKVVIPPTLVKAPKELKVKNDLTPTTDFEKNLKLEVFAMDCNGMPTLMLSHDDPDSNKVGKQLGFNFYGSYLSVEIKTQKILTQVIDGILAAGFILTPNTEKVLEKIDATFKGVKNKEKAFNLISKLDKRVFFNPATFKSKFKDPTKLRMYPIVEDGDRLCLYINLAVGDPAAIKLKQLKKVPGAPQLRWNMASGTWVYMGNSKGELLKKLAQFKDVGIKVSNLLDVKESINNLF